MGSAQPAGRALIARLGSAQAAGGAAGGRAQARASPPHAAAARLRR